MGCLKLQIKSYNQPVPEFTEFTRSQWIMGIMNR